MKRRPSRDVWSDRATEAREVDTETRASRRRRREEELRPQERVAAVLRGREQLDACETLLLRARTDLNANRHREAALQLRVGLEALLVELKNALADPDHEKDMGTLNERRTEAGEAANAALQGDLTPEQRTQVTRIAPELGLMACQEPRTFLQEPCRRGGGNHGHRSA